MASVQERWASEATRSGGPAWLESQQQKGRAAWLASQWPTRKTEEWKYTPLKSLESVDLELPSSVDPSNVTLENTNIAGLEAIRLVFVNGLFVAELSDLDDLPSGAHICAFSEADSGTQPKIKQKLNSTLDLQQFPFAALNAAKCQEGAFIWLERGTELTKPVVLLFVGGSEWSSFSAPRVLVALDEQSQATVVEHFIDIGSAGQNASSSHFSCGVSELLVAENASLTHYRLHMEEGTHKHIGGVHAVLQRNARINGFHLALGSALKRVDLVVHHRGEGAECTLNGIYLPRDGDLVDYHTCIEHAVPHCTTTENFRGIVGGDGKAVFNGRIHIHPQAQKTLAQLNNRNLLTSNKAEVDTKPELEIYADDVQCAHGATVAQLDETALHYFRTRGVSQKEAEVMLSFGFINELLNTIKDQPIADYLRPLLAEKFARDPSLLRHIV